VTLLWRRASPQPQRLIAHRLQVTIGPLRGVRGSVKTIVVRYRRDCAYVGARADVKICPDQPMAGRFDRRGRMFVASVE
jgi:hypothetical protein